MSNNNSLISISIIIDNDKLYDSIHNMLVKNGFQVNRAKDINEATENINITKPDLIIVDNDLDGIPGVGACSILRTRENITNLPIILLTDNEQELNNIKNINIGIDDYIAKPLSITDFLYKIKNILRRSNITFNKLLEYQDIKIDLYSYRVIRGNKEIHLGPIEFKILQYFIENPNKILSRESIIQNVWDKNAKVGIRTVDIHINRLRTNLKYPNEHISPIKTVRSLGYRLG